MSNYDVRIAYLILNLYYMFLAIVVIKNYCTAAPNATVSNSVIVGTYGRELSNSSTVGCAYEYAANGTSSTATCSTYNATNGKWSGLSMTCNSMSNTV